LLSQQMPKNIAEPLLDNNNTASMVEEFKSLSPKIHPVLPEEYDKEKWVSAFEAYKLEKFVAVAQSSTMHIKHVLSQFNTENEKKAVSDEESDDEKSPLNSSIDNEKSLSKMKLQLSKNTARYQLSPKRKKEEKKEEMTIEEIRMLGKNFVPQSKL